MGKNELVCDCDAIHQKEVFLAKQKMLDEEKLLLVADFYKILSDSTRIKIVNLLEDNEEVWYSLADDHVKEVFDVSLEHVMEGYDDKEN